MNIHEMDAASNNGVEEMRALTDQVRFAPQAGQYKVYIIDEVHMLTAASFNAFLKTLEEPPAHAIFILATTEKHKILPTILRLLRVQHETQENPQQKSGSLRSLTNNNFSKNELPGKPNQ